MLISVQEMSLEHLGDVKAASIAEWVSIDAVRRAIQKHFRSFLMTYVDENGQSVYGQRIKHLGEGEFFSFDIKDPAYSCSQLRVARSLVHSLGQFPTHPRIFPRQLSSTHAGAL